MPPMDRDSITVPKSAKCQVKVIFLPFGVGRLPFFLILFNMIHPHFPSLSVNDKRKKDTEQCDKN